MHRRVVFFVLGLCICVCVEESLGTTAITIDECEFHILQVFPKVLLILWSSGAFSARGPSALWNFFTMEVFFSAVLSISLRVFIQPDSTVHMLNWNIVELLISPSAGIRVLCPVTLPGVI